MYITKQSEADESIENHSEMNWLKLIQFLTLSSINSSPYKLYIKRASELLITFIIRNAWINYYITYYSITFSSESLKWNFVHIFMYSWDASMKSGTGSRKVGFLLFNFDIWLDYFISCQV